MRMSGCGSCLQFFTVKSALKGYRKRLRVPDSRLPISGELLASIGETTKEACFSPYEALLFRVAFYLCFFGAFRVSELLPRKLGDSSGTLFTDVMLKFDCVHILLRKSKIDPLGRGKWITLRKNLSSQFCVFTLLQQYLNYRPSFSTHFLIHMNGKSVTVYQFSAVLKKCLLRLNLENLKITSHSFRIGTATEAAMLGFNETVIKNIGRWKSNCYRSYVWPNFPFNFR